MKKILIGLTLTFSLTGLTGLTHAAGDAAAGEAKAVVCAACHGSNGVSQVPNWPNLAGQGANYLTKQLTDIRDGRRTVAEMAPFVADLSDRDIRDISAFYAGQPANLGQTDPALAERGRNLYRAGDLAKGIPACTACHLPNGNGNHLASFPALAGQHPTYTVTQLKAFRDGGRTNDPASMMSLIAEKMSDAEIDAVASYVYGLHGTNR